MFYYKYLFYICIMFAEATSCARCLAQEYAQQSSNGLDQKAQQSTTQQENSKDENQASSSAAVTKAAVPRHGAVEEIIVTANFREQSAQDVAGSLSGYDQSRIKELGLTDMSDLTRFTPSLNNNDRGEGRNDLNIRGIGRTGTFAVFGPSPVGLYLDDISLNTFGNAFDTGQADVNYFGIQRVEVLFGPQSTLYGESAEGGAVKFISKDPSLEQSQGIFGLGAFLPYGGSVRGSAQASVDVPLLPNSLGANISIGRTEKSGFIDNATDGANNINHSKSDLARVVFLSNVTDYATARLAVHYQRLKMGAAQITDEDQKELKISYKNSNDWASDRFLVVPLKLRFNFDSFAVESISGYYDRAINVYRWDSLAATFASIIGLTPVTGRFLDGHINSANAYRQRSQEVRVITTADTDVSAILGLYYRNADAAGRFFTTSQDLPGVTTTVDGSISRSKQRSAFFEASWKPYQSWTGTIGARGVIEDTNIFFNDSSLYGIPGPTRQYQLHLSKFLPMARLEFRPQGGEESSLYYFRYATGTRIGGANTPLTVEIHNLLYPTDNPNRFDIYLPDSVKTLEVGNKNALFEGAWIVNGAIYYNLWRNLQVPVANPFVNVTNAGSARGYGVEVDTTLKASDEWHFNFGAQAGVSKIATQILAASAGVTNNFTNTYVEPGTPIPYAKRFGLAGGVKNVQTFGGDWQVTTSLSYTYSGSYTQDLQSPDRLGNYGLLDFGWEFVDNKRWTINVHFENILNRIVKVATSPGTKAYEQLIPIPPAPGQSIDENYINTPRAWELSGTYHFGGEGLN